MRPIDADALLMELDKLNIPFRRSISEAITNAPEVYGRSGKWLPTYRGFFRCSCCQKVRYMGELTDYCPNCGARMEVENETEPIEKTNR